LERSFVATPNSFAVIGFRLRVQKAICLSPQMGETPTGLQNRLNSIMIMKFE